MKCIACGEQMKCLDDVVTETVRIDWLECLECNSFAQIEYNRAGQKKSVLWLKDRPNKQR